MKQIISFTIVLFFLFGWLVPVQNICAANEKYNISDNLEITNTSFDTLLDADLKGDGVIYVTMHHEVSDVGKVYTTSDFPELDIESIEDLTGANLAERKEDYGENFRNVLKITLLNKSNDSVIESIKKLQNRANKDIYWAEPAYLTLISDFVTGTIEVQSTEVEADAFYWKRIIKLTEALQYLSDNGIDLDNSNTLRVAFLDSYIIKDHEDLYKGETYFLDNEYGRNMESYASDHATACAGVTDLVCDGIEMVSIALPPVALLEYGDASFDGVKYINQIVECLNNSSEAIDIASMSSTPVLSKFYNISTCANIINNYKGLIVCLAHNDRVNLDDTSLNDNYKRFPTILEANNLLVVGGSNPNDDLWTQYDHNGILKGTNTGVVSVDLFAPAQSIETYAFTENGSTTIKRQSGTSFATPMVAGVATLMKLANPDITPLQIKAILMNTADRKDAFIGKCVSGGRLNAYEAVRIAYGLANGGLSTSDKNKADYLFHASTNTIVKYLGKQIAPVIPQKINDVNVTKIGGVAFDKNTTITTINIPDHITELGTYSFRGCTNLKTVTIPSSINAIPKGAFAKCSSLQSVTYSNELHTIGDYAFSGSGLETMHLHSNITSIGASAFGSDTVLVVPYDSVAYYYGIDNNYFTMSVYGNTIFDFHDKFDIKLHRIDIPTSFFGTPITAIGNHAFDGTDYIEVVNIPSTVTSIGYRAFRNCSNLKLLVIPPSVGNISNSMNSTIVEGSSKVVLCSAKTSYASIYAESNDISCLLMAIRTNDNNKTYASVCGVFEAEGCGTEYIIPESFGGYTVTMVDSDAFRDNMGLPRKVTKIYVPKTVEEIGSYAFANCTSLTDVYIYSKTTTIDVGCFAGVNNSIFKIHCYATSPAHVYAMTNGHLYDIF